MVYDNVATMPVEEAWENVVNTAKEAVESRDLDDFREVRDLPSLIDAECYLPLPLLANYSI